MKTKRPRKTPAPTSPTLAQAGEEVRRYNVSRARLEEGERPVEYIHRLREFIAPLSLRAFGYALLEPRFKATTGCGVSMLGNMLAADRPLDRSDAARAIDELKEVKRENAQDYDIEPEYVAERHAFVEDLYRRMEA